MNAGHITLGEQIAVVDMIRREHTREKQEAATELRMAVDVYLAGDSALEAVTFEFSDELIESVLRVADQLAPPADRGERMLRSLTADDFGHSRKA